MCPLDIPHSFTPGTKAKANEVNANFNSIKTFVDANEVNIAQNELSISGLQENKADLNGAIENKFQVANPTGNYDAVNKQTLNALTANTKDYIGGFKLTKYSDDTITADPGNAWDSTHSYMFNQSTALQVTQSNLGANATYYVYITGGEDVVNTLVISLSNATPELPSGATVYRLLGSFTTDNDADIFNVSYYGNTVVDNSLYRITSAVVPNYKSPQTIANGYVTTFPCYITCYANIGGWSQLTLYADGTRVDAGINHDPGRRPEFVSGMFGAGVEVTNSASANMTMFPLMGVTNS